MEFRATIFVLLYLSSAKAIEPDGIFCFANQELSFFCDAKLFTGAKKSCADTNAVLVKIDSANMTEVINTLIDNVKCPYPNSIFIGATAKHHRDYPNDWSKRIWKWFDGSRVFLPGDNGYHNWQSGQPNDVGGNEDCVILDRNTKKWKDTTCIDHPGEEKHYICQKDATMNFKVSQTLNEVRCEAATGYCRSHIKWRRDSSIVSYNSSEAVYQIGNLTSSTLQYKNATIGDAGRYDCVDWIAGVEAISKSIPIDLSVNGTPEVIEIRSFPCNTSLHIAWKPQLQSLGFLHRILATASPSGKLLKVVEVTPTNAVLHLTEVTELNPSTEYYIKVIACKEVNNCSDEYAVMKTATTLGIIITVTNATIQQNIDALNETCVITWQGTKNTNITFWITTYNSTDETLNTSVVEQTIFTQNNSYLFTPSPGREYDVEVKPVTSKNYCPRPVKAIGSCIGKREVFPAPLDQSNISVVVATSVAIFILLVVIFSTAIYVHKRKSESPQNPMPESVDVHDYATVGNPEIYEAAYLDLTDNTVAQANTDVSTGNFSYENIAQNLSPTYETIKNTTTSEY